ncbi:MAG TPA: hypothetical protein VFR32_07850 [Gaiellaceae bacterium]|nr:hypothetical protein [Gaiellaceae bacterium]
MTGSLTAMALLIVFVAAMLSFGAKIGMLERPTLTRCGACGRLRRGHICPCSRLDA